MTQDLLWFVHVFDDYVKRHKLMKNFSPEDILHCCHDLSEKEREWLDFFTKSDFKNIHSWRANSNDWAGTLVITGTN